MEETEEARDERELSDIKDSGLEPCDATLITEGLRDKDGRTST